MIKARVKVIIGNMLVFFQPIKAKRLVEKGLTIPEKLTFKERLMRDAIMKKAVENKNFDALSEFHKNYWIEKGEGYFSYTTNILENFFKPKCSFLIDMLQEKLKNESINYHTLVEIGTGNGQVLEYLSSRLIEIDNFVGIDLSIAQIERNKIDFEKNSKLEFLAIDGFDWLKKNGTSGMIIVTSRGVLEYFTESKLQELFDFLNELGHVIFIAIEPTAIGHDFSKQPHSYPFGFESSFSHNYIRLFENSGFTIWHHSKIAYSAEFNFNFIGAEN
ncbi:methyltransferase family protein [Mariniflexile fucanivorans]|uniref:Methyltransferase family protein n=1 Tax=Mariniflexile fucanivorans TaxID=264023 RepID=A0A4R1RR05_9FLAO|nr:class I SAM-dependent methyltransferase [Mariniflexile fucanivorans]TCL68861.1 methyltransferase family protein [Mariniflexile fucanivorans]